MKLQDWPVADLLLHVGEMTAQEKRTVYAVLAYIDTTRKDPAPVHHKIVGWMTPSGALYRVRQKPAMTCRPLIICPEENP